MSKLQIPTVSLIYNFELTYLYHLYGSETLELSIDHDGQPCAQRLALLHGV